MTDPLDAQIAAIADGQSGNITRRQLLRLGLTHRAIDLRLRRGLLYLVYPGVYSVGVPPRTPLQRAHAAALACGELGMVGGHSGLALWSFTNRWPVIPEIMTPHNRRPRGILVHRSTTLDGERTVQLGVPVTTPARTILDASPTLGPRITRVVNDALHTPYLRRHHLAETCDRHPNHPGVRLLLPFYTTSDAPTDSALEDELLPFCDRTGLPRPVLGFRLGRRRLDAVFVDERVIAELDGWGSHSSRDRFEADRERDADHLALGYATIRITRRRLLGESAREAARLHRILARRRAELGLAPRSSRSAA